MSDRARHSKAPADHRRKWDTVEFEKVAKAREDVEKAINRDKSRDVKEDPVKRELLKIRDYKVDLDSRLGKSVIVQKNTHTGEGAGGYYCNVCDCVVKVSFGMSSIIYILCVAFYLYSIPGLYKFSGPHQWQETSEEYGDEHENREILIGSSERQIC